MSDGAGRVEEIIHHLTLGQYGNPCEVLGMHRDGNGVVIRSWLPFADGVEVLDLKYGKSLGAMAALGGGLFELKLPRRRSFFKYKLTARYCESLVELYDPYALFDLIETQLGQRQEFHLHRFFGSQLCTLNYGSDQVEGVLFRVHAPAASSVSVVGSFNYWNGSQHPMQRTGHGDWTLFIPGLQPGETYKYHIHDQRGNLLPLKADPFAHRCEPSPGNASIVYRDDYAWGDDKWRGRGQDNLSAPVSIYEMHIGSWRRADDGRQLSYGEVAQQLVPYLRDAGFTHVELLPIMEHPFEGSWGYQPTGLFAATSRFGQPHELKAFIDQLHQAGIGVILDWVPAHFPNDEFALAQFDGTALYEHPDPRRGWHPDWQSYIYDFGKPWVVSFLISSAVYWLEEFHFDGLRVDAVASMLYLDYSRNEGEWEPNCFGGNENLEAIEFLKTLNSQAYQANPNIMMIAEESTAWPKVSWPVFEGGLGFGFKWNMGWMHDTLSYMAREPIHRQYHHGEATFSLVYAFDEHFVLALSHDEVVHGKGSLLNKMPGDGWQKHANLRALYGYMWAHPGKKSLMMGSEFAQPEEWNHNTALNWALLQQPAHAGTLTLLSELNRIYRNYPAMHLGDCRADGFQWLDHQDARHSILAFERHGGEQCVTVVVNLTPSPREGYRVGVNRPGGYRLLLNSDASAFGGSDYPVEPEHQAEAIAAQGRQHSCTVSLPPLSVIYLVHGEEYRS